VRIRSRRLKLSKEVIKLLTVVVSHIDGIFVVADKNRITQVITNLLDNALKFTSKGVQIWAQNNNDKGKSGATLSFSLPLN
jgi:signal transduction histidine kinase